jgi:hypothetical protein
MTKWIERRWQTLDPAPDKPIFQLVDAEHPLSFYIGRDITGEFLLLLVEPIKPPPLNSMRGVKISTFQRAGGEWALLLKLTDSNLLNVFTLLCEDLVISSRTVLNRNSGSGFVIARIRTWRKLLEEDQIPQLSKAEVRGLFGELHFLKNELAPKIGMLNAVSSWSGPFGAAQDFQTIDHAYEVKTIHPDGPVVTISSENQLHSEDRIIFLIVLSIFESASGPGLSLNSLIALLRADLSHDDSISREFEARLAATKYVVLEIYDRPMFSVVSKTTYFVGNSFPALHPTMLPEGVINIKYQIQLSSCQDHKAELSFVNMVPE